MKLLTFRVVSPRYDHRIVITENPMTAQERRTVSSLAVVYCSRMLGLFMVLPLLALYAADLPGASPTLIGLAMGMYGLMQAALQIPLGWLSDQIGRRPVIIGGLVIFALGSAVAAMASASAESSSGRMLQGAGAISSTVMALVADLTREEQRTKAMAVIGMSIGLSFGVALVCGPVIASTVACQRCSGRLRRCRCYASCWFWCWFHIRRNRVESLARWFRPPD